MLETSVEVEVLYVPGGPILFFNFYLRSNLNTQGSSELACITYLERSGSKPSHSIGQSLTSQDRTRAEKGYQSK